MLKRTLNKLVYETKKIFTENLRGLQDTKTLAKYLGVCSLQKGKISLFQSSLREFYKNAQNSLNKKAEEKVLTPNFITLVIGVIGLLLVFGGAYLFYKNVTADQEIESAKSTLNTIIEKIEFMKQGQGKFTIQGFKNSENWFLMAWNKNDPTDTKPEKCFLNSCLCLCKPSEKFSEGNYNWKENCQNRGFCTEIKDKDIFVNNFDISTIKSATAPGTAGIVYYKEKPEKRIIQLRPVLMELNIEKTPNLINLTYYTDEYLSKKNE